MAIITLTSDWGYKDYYLAVVKGSILRLCPDVTIIDISHDILSFDITQAAFIVKNSYRYFPEGTIHIISINSIENENSPQPVKHIVMFADKHYFIGADNGLFSMICEDSTVKCRVEKIVEINKDKIEKDFYSFPERSIFVQAACHIAKGRKIEELGKIKKHLIERRFIQPVTTESSIIGHIIYIDKNGNAITNISYTLFNDIRRKREFSIFIKRQDYEITEISKSYNSVEDGEKLALFNSAGYLEISMNMGNAGTLLGLTYNDSVRIEFHHASGGKKFSAFGG